MHVPQERGRQRQDERGSGNGDSRACTAGLRQWRLQHPAAPPRSRCLIRTLEPSLRGFVKGSRRLDRMADDLCMRTAAAAAAAAAWGGSRPSVLSTPSSAYQSLQQLSKGRLGRTAGAAPRPAAHSRLSAQCAAHSDRR